MLKRIVAKTSKGIVTQTQIPIRTSIELCYVYNKNVLLAKIKFKLEAFQTKTRTIARE